MLTIEQALSVYSDDFPLEDLDYAAPDDIAWRLEEVWLGRNVKEPYISVSADVFARHLDAYLFVEQGGV